MINQGCGSALFFADLDLDPDPAVFLNADPALNYRYVKNTL